MPCVKLVFPVVILWATSCLCQVNGGPYIVSRVLGDARVSGSLAYWSPGPCNPSSGRFPLAPVLREAKVSSPIVDVLRDMFADDAKMRVIQEPSGIVRMFETDVPMDLLSVTIHHISFDVAASESSDFHGPNIAILMILASPEVVKFRKEHHIGPFESYYRMPGDSASDKPSVSGTLDNVTLAQALDHIFQTFPGLWIYGNCASDEKEKGDGRNVYFWFLENAPPKH